LEATLIRGGELVKIPTTELVPGDIIKLSPGVKLAADIILLHAVELKVDMSSLTGEVLPLDRKVVELGSKDVEEAHESMNMIFSTNIIVSGEGMGIVTRTGHDTLVNQINIVSSKESRKRSPLSLEIKEFCKQISLISVIIAFFFFIVAVIRGRNFNYASTFAIGIILAMIPQGLPLTVTFILAVSGRRMLQKNVVVKDLHGIETLGAITMLGKLN
jgi:sodium/potassium-transporting ATPase subunit alpha